jgi:competence protein ComEC
MTSAQLVMVIAAFIPIVLPGSPTFATGSSNDSKGTMIIWNVGQGLWVTWVLPDACLHFDAGGERAPWKKLRSACRNRRNILHFSHWDWDHIGLAAQLAKHVSSVCIRDLPLGPRSPAKERFLSKIPVCEDVVSTCGGSGVTEIFSGIAAKKKAKKISSNETSRVYLIDGRWRSALLPGDSVSGAEKIWAEAPALRNQISRIGLLVLGHHGSRTSTSSFLLERLPRLRQAVASARKSRYGHPHEIIRSRLHRRGVALLSTEDWGTLIWPLPSIAGCDLTCEQDRRECRR